MFDCPKCGPVPYLMLNGYDFGDRILENVMFRILKKDGELSVEPVNDWKKDAYCIQLNYAHWMEQAHRHIEDLDVANCPTRGCGEDIEVG